MKQAIRIGPGYLRRLAVVSLTCVCAGTLANSLWAADDPAAGAPPDIDQRRPRNVFWGDTHLHTTNSPDSWTYGNHSLTPDDAFRFARGAAVTTSNGTRMRLRRPLDFLVVSDHGEYLGLFPSLEARRPEIVDTETGQRWLGIVESGEDGAERVFAEFMQLINGGQVTFTGKELTRSVWHEVTATADRNNDPGKFTAFIGYEWTSMPKGANLHRVVVFADDAAKADQVIPLSTIDSPRPEDLWQFLADYEKKTGGAVMAIPHNSNTSAGRMFSDRDSHDKPLTRAYAQTRARWETLVEATQVKGDSETHPVVSPTDEFADYESWDQNAGFSAQPHEDWMFRHEYVRPTLGLGLALEDQLGTNPFKLGMIGSSDSHTGMSTVDEDDFGGKFTINEPRQGRSSRGMTDNAGADTPNWQLAASGYAAVWAHENTRESLFQAMRRRETYATTGPRMLVRFFGGWNFQPQHAVAPDTAAVGYALGVPMGGTLHQAPADGGPTFLVSASRDPQGANLDRVQIIKIWSDGKGTVHERIFDLAVSGGRKIDADGRCRTAVGSTVDVGRATYTNAIGDPQLIAMWQDPAFDPRRRAAYYVRVLEIPTPRWTTYDAARYGDPLPPQVSATTQDRAYTSPIWYSPGR